MFEIRFIFKLLAVMVIIALVSIAIKAWYIKEQVLNIRNQRNTQINNNL